MKKIILGAVLLVCVLFNTACGAAGTLVGTWINPNNQTEIYEYKSNGDFIVSELVFDAEGNIVDQMVKTKGIYLVDDTEIKEFVVEEKEIKETDGVKNYTGKIKSSGKINEYIFQVDSNDQITRAVPVKDENGNVVNATKAQILQRVN